MSTARKLVDLNGVPANVDVSMIDVLSVHSFNRKLGDSLVEKVDAFVRESGAGFDVVQGDFLWPYGYAAARLGERHGVPSGIILHENRDWLLSMLSAKDPRYEWALRHASALLRVNRIDLPALRQLNPSADEMIGGFDMVRFFMMDRNEARSKVGLPPGKPIVFSLGYLVERKGFRLLVDAMREVVRSHPGASCIIGGEGPLRKELQKRIEELGLIDSVRLIGRISDDALPFYYNSADLFVLPSFSEGNPTVMFESLGCGTPFVGTPVGGVPEVITSSEFGLLTQMGNSEELAQAISIGISKTWNRTEIRKYAEQYSWQNSVDKLYQVYEKLV
jgi:glycosyltransferase involved in cell wall biosynthesis